MVRLCVRVSYVAITIFLASCAWNASSEARVPKGFDAGQAMNFTVEGKVNTLGQNKLTLRAEENVIFHVRYDDKTEFKNDDGSPATSKDLHINQKIRVEGDLTESGEIVATKIQLLETPAKK